jgi:hypothetical protein
MLAVYAGLLILIAAVIGSASLAWLTSTSADRLAVISNFLALGTLLLALIAGIVALAAYSAATGLPNLRAQTVTDRGMYNQPWFRNSGNRVDDDVTCWIVVENVSSYAARSPAVIVEFEGAAIPADRYAQSSGWIAISRDSGRNITAVQWDGGPNAIHGRSARHLPDLRLQGLTRSQGGPRMIIRLFADGYNRPEIRMQTVFIDDSEDLNRRLEEERPPEWL